MEDDLSLRLDRLESHQAVENLASHYCRGFDSRDEEMFMGIWWQDATWNIGPPFGSFYGHDGIKAALHDTLWPAWAMSQHITSNIVIEFSGRDSAIMKCDVDCTGRLSSGPEATFVGASYEDRVERRDGQWRIATRDVTMHYFNSFPNTTLNAPVG